MMIYSPINASKYIICAPAQNNNGAGSVPNHHQLIYLRRLLCDPALLSLSFFMAHVNGNKYFRYRKSDSFQ